MRAITGNALVSGSAARASSTSKPEMSGSIRSTMISAGCLRRAISMPSRPSAAVSSRNPAGASTERRMVATTGSSSMASTSGCFPSAFPCARRPMLSRSLRRSSGFIR